MARRAVPRSRPAQPFSLLAEAWRQAAAGTAAIPRTGKPSSKMDRLLQLLAARTAPLLRQPLSLRTLLERAGELRRVSRLVARLVLVYLKIPLVLRECETAQAHRGLSFVRQHFERCEISVVDGFVGPSRGVPTSGAAVVVANHPAGITDGLALLHWVGRQRTDVSLVVNYLVGEVEELAARFSDALIYVNPFGRAKEKKSSQAGLRKIFQAIQRGEVVIFFPAGDVASFHWRDLKVTDPPWNDTCGRLLAHLAAPVIPVSIANRNSRLFYLINKLDNRLGLALLFREHFKQHGRTIAIHAGPTLARRPDESPETFSARLRAEVEALSASS